MCESIDIQNHTPIYVTVAIPFKQIDVLAMIAIGQTTGRRKFELLTITPADIELDITKKDNGIVVREMRLTYCWKKNLGVGNYQQLIVGNSILEKDAISFILLKLQHQGMINSALDVYRGDEELDIDDSLYESSGLLQTKLRSAAKSLNKNQREQFEHGTNDPSASLLSSLINEESTCSPDYRIPFWVATDPTLNSVTSNRMTESSANEYISKMLCKTARNKNHHGYQSSLKHKIGITSTRKSFRTNTSGAISANANFDMQNHLSKQCSHTEEVGKRHYENELDYQATIPANIQQVDDQATANAIMMSVEYQPLYKQDGYHVPGHQFYTDPLPKPEAFLEEQSASATPNGLGVIRCPVKDCNHQKSYRYYADFVQQHLRPSHYITKNKKTKNKSLDPTAMVKCPACEGQYKATNFFVNHVVDKGSRGMCKMIDSNIFARKVVATRAAAAKEKMLKRNAKKKSNSAPLGQPKPKRQNLSQNDKNEPGVSTLGNTESESDKEGELPGGNNISGGRHGATAPTRNGTRKRNLRTNDDTNITTSGTTNQTRRRKSSRNIPTASYKNLQDSDEGSDEEAIHVLGNEDDDMNIDEGEYAPMNELEIGALSEFPTELDDDEQVGEI